MHGTMSLKFNNISYVLLNIWLILPDSYEVFYGIIYKKLETVQRFIYHYNVFSQTVRVKKAMSKRNIVVFRCSFYVERV